MNNNILFSIVIPTYNRANLLKRCLDSVEAQTYQKWEAIVVDNFSEDNTEEVVQSYNDPRIVYIKNHNYGVIAVSRNKALDVVRGDWVAFLDSDDCWLPQKLETMVQYVNDYDLIYHGYQMNIPPKGLFQRRNEFFYEVKKSSVPYVLMRGDPINPSCTCVSRNAIGNIRFSEDRDLIAVEDYDFFLQLIAKGIKIKYLRVVLTLYDVSGCSHNASASERDVVIFNKWKDYLNPAEEREVEIQYFWRKASFLLSESCYSEAKVFYKKMLKSHMYSKQIIAIKGLIRCTLRIK